MAKRFPWKSNYRRIPPFVNEALNKIDSDIILVSAIKKIGRAEIADGRYVHLGLSLNHNEIITSGPVTPPIDVGKWSERNISGWDLKRKDLPMVQKTWTFESPNFGDGARNGYTMRSWTKDVYQHQIFEPQGMTVEATILDAQSADYVAVRFSLQPMLKRSMAEFDLMLLWSINVLQENAGVTNVFASNASDKDYKQTIALDWQIFPPSRPSRAGPAKARCP